MRLLKGLFGLTLLLSSQAWALSTDELFTKARDAYKARDDFALSNYTDQMQAQGYVLAPYADYWLMLLRMSQADNQTVRAFINRYPDLPFTDRVRGEWLKALGKRQDWQTFFEELPNFTRDDVAVSCYALDGRAQTGNVEALASGKSIWMTSAEQPVNCEQVFDRMQKAHVLSDDDIWMRFRLAMQDGKISVAKSIPSRISGFSSAEIKLIDRVYQNPQQVLEKKTITLQSRYGRELNLYALDRLARTQPSYALDIWLKIQPSFSAEDKSYLWGRFALHAARRHDQAAQGWFDRVQKGTLDKEQLAWKARTALRVKDWPSLQATISEMPVAQQDESVWRYWKGRALREQKQILAANVIFVPLSRERSYYGVLAEEELGDVISGVPSSYKPAEVEINTIAGLPGIQRAVELLRFDMRWESRAEWAWATRNFDDRQMIAAAELAARQQWYDLAIITADKTKFMHDYSLRYPTPYRDMMQSFSREQNLDEAWVYGLTRQESRFIHYAKSGVGAAGLMQVMPATASWIAKRMGLGGYNNGMIHQLDTNIQLGTYYMRYTLDLMDNQVLMATAAYNAGPSRAKRWAASVPLEGAIYAETIPFTETRGYVQKVMGNAYFYAQQLGTKIQTLKQRMGTISASGGTLTVDEAE
ncbi:MAG: transglycosylase SLT domain-containing protein [Methylophilaceae bacterium]